MNGQIRKIKTSDMVSIAQIHKQCFQDTLLTKFGNKFLQAYYMAYIEDNPDTSYVYINETGQPIGFLIGIMNGNITRNNFFKNNFLMFIISILQVLIQYRIAFIKQIFPKIKGVFNKPKEDFRDKIGSKGGILSIAILDQYRGKGIAEQLVNSFEEAYYNKGERVYNLGVKKDNLRAIKFYEKIGFQFGQAESETIDLYYKRLDKRWNRNEKC